MEGEPPRPVADDEDAALAAADQASAALARESLDDAPLPRHSLKLYNSALGDDAGIDLDHPRGWSGSSCTWTWWSATVRRCTTCGRPRRCPSPHHAP